MTDLVKELYKKPKREHRDTAPRFGQYKPGVMQQADLLFLPSDDGFKYLLVVVDVGSRLTDAEPLKNKLSAGVLKAFKAIYARKTLLIPKNIQVDSGSEFKADVAKWFHEKGIGFRIAKPYRHRQQAFVERRNQMIGKMLFQRMTAQELMTRETSREWVDDLPDVLSIINKKAKKFMKKLKPFKNEYIVSNDSKILLPEGSKVRVALDAPVDVVSGKRLHGKFRDTDIRWDIKPRIIKQVIIQPNQPPLYLVDDGKGDTDHRQAYTKHQLLPVHSNERKPKESQIRPETTNGVKKWVVDKIIDKRNINKKIQYLIQWKGFEKQTWEPRKTMLEDAPDAVRDFQSR